MITPDPERLRKPTWKENIVETVCGVAVLVALVFIMLIVAIDWLFMGEKE